jgi:NADH oxidase (H2O2-forming)
MPDLKKQQTKVDLAVIGNGVAGNNAAFSARRLDPDMNILIIGGENCCEYAAGALPDYLQGNLEREQIFIKEIEDYEKNNIQVKMGERALKVDPDKKVIETDKGRIKYKKLVLALGSEAIVLRIPGADLPGNFVMKRLEDADKIGSYKAKSAVVIGSGAIGLESALALRGKGVKNVTLIEMMDWVMPKSLDETSARKIEKLLEEQGVTVLTSEKVKEVQGKKKVEQVVTDKQSIKCDMVIWAVGVLPVVDLAKDMGVELGVTGGIKVDSHMKTNLDDVYACGDCVESTDIFTKKQVLNMLWESAARQGTVAGTNCVQESSIFEGSFAVLLSYVGEVPILAFGLTQKDLEGEHFEVLEYKGDETYQCIIVQDEKIMGVQMIGTLDGSAWMLAQLKKGSPLNISKLKNRRAAKMYPVPAALAAYLSHFQSTQQ